MGSLRFLNFANPIYSILSALAVAVIVVAVISNPLEAQEKKSLKGIMGDQKGKNAALYVKSDSLQLDAKSRVFIYDGNVEIVRGDVRITCDSMRGTYGDDSKLKTILCKDNVVITRGNVMRASSNRAHYDVDKSVIKLTEGPELARDGNLLSADKITIFVDEDRSEAEGNVRVKVIKAEDESSNVANFDEEAVKDSEGSEFGDLDQATVN